MKNRLFFILWITIMAILWLAGNLRSAGIILADSLLAAVILSVQAAVSAKGLRVDYRLKGSYNGENQASLQINTNYNGLLPVKLYLQMQVENQLTGEKQSMRADGIRPGRGVGNKSLTVELEDTHAGKLQVQIEQIAVTDLFGLLRFRLGGRRKQNRAVQRLSCLMLPQAAIRRSCRRSSVSTTRTVTFTRRTGPDLIRARPMNCGITAAVTVCAAYTGNSAVGATTGSFAKEAGRSDKNCCCFWKTAIHPHGPVPEHPGAGVYRRSPAVRRTMTRRMRSSEPARA